MQVTLEVDTGDSFELCYALADAGAESERRAHLWNEGAGEHTKDQIYQRLMADAAFFRRLAKAVARQMEKKDAATRPQG